jgi:hypothetical protein
LKSTISFFFLIPLTIILSFSVFNTISIVSSQQPFHPGNEINVTQDMIILLSNLTDLFSEKDNSISTNIGNNFFDESQQSNLSLINLYGDPESIALGGIVLLENSSRLVYQTNPFFITEGQLSANLPCDGNTFTNIMVLGGNISAFQALPLEPIYEFSDPGRLCSYQSSLLSNATHPISQIVIRNNSTEEVVLPLSSKIMIGVSKLANNDTIN